MAEANSNKWGSFSEWTGGSFLQLKQWLNSNFKKLFDRISSPENIVIGDYNGDGRSSRFINLGFTPVALELYDSSGRQYNEWFYYGGLVINDGHGTSFKIVNNGFEVYQDRGDYYSANEFGRTYRFVAYKNYEIRHIGGNS